MRFNFRLLTAIAVLAASCVANAQSSGTAFVVAPGLLVTNHHVIEGCGAVEVIASDGRRPATVVDSVKQIDLALLRVYGLRGGVASLRTKSPTLLGESATVFGFPLGGALSSTGNFTTGVVSSLRGLRDAAGEIQITAPVQPGNSGGPVLDRSGAVIGVVQSKLDALKAVRATGDIPQNVNFAVSLDVLADFLEKNNVQFKSAERQPAIETTQVAEMAQSFTYKISCTRATRTATAPTPQAPTPALIPPVTKTPAPLAPATPKPDKLVQDIQTALNQKGFNAGPADGLIGPQTQAAITAAQRTLNLTVNGLPSEILLAAIRSLTSPPVGSTKPEGYNAAKSKSYQDAINGINAYNGKDYKAALRIFLPLALNGNAYAQNGLGLLYFRGQDVTQSNDEAIKWFRLSAAQGNAKAQNSLGWLYLHGIGVSKNYAEALKWFQQSANQGDARAQTSIGFMYEKGFEVLQDDVEAVKWYKLSAAQGYAIGQNNLGFMHEYGRGVFRSQSEALRLYRMSAAQGNNSAKKNLERLAKQGIQ